MDRRHASERNIHCDIPVAPIQDWSEAIVESDIYLKIVGNDEDVQKMRSMATTNLGKKSEEKS